jgi:hypothetical protein
MLGFRCQGKSFEFCFYLGSLCQPFFRVNFYFNLASFFPPLNQKKVVGKASRSVIPRGVESVEILADTAKDGGGPKGKISKRT